VTKHVNALNPVKTMNMREKPQLWGSGRAANIITIRKLNANRLATMGTDGSTGCCSLPFRLCHNALIHRTFSGGTV